MYWGAECEVVEPEDLREMIVSDWTSICELYSRGRSV